MAKGNSPRIVAQTLAMRVVALRVEQPSFLEKTMERTRSIVLGICATAFALWHVPAMASGCLNLSTFPETIGVQTVAGQTRLELGEPVFNAALEQVTVTGFSANVAIEHLNSVCGVGTPPAAQTILVPLGFLPSGSYELRVRNREVETGQVFEVVRSFVVSGGGVGASAAVPTLSVGALLALALLMIAVAGIRMRRGEG